MPSAWGLTNHPLHYAKSIVWWDFFYSYWGENNGHAQTVQWERAKNSA